MTMTNTFTLTPPPATDPNAPVDIWWLNDESEQMLNRGYLLKGETVEGAIDRITEAAAKRLYKPELKEKFKQLITRGWLSLSSPVWANMGTQRGLPISCFNVHIPLCKPK